MVRLLVIGLAVALAAVAAVALHYRAQAGQLRERLAASQSATSFPPEMADATLRLPADGPIGGVVVIVAAAQPGAGRGQFVVSAVIHGGQPDTEYDLIGSDCSAPAPLPGQIWATGFTDAVGAADLTGYAWSGAVGDEYWLVLTPSPVYPPPGLRGRFAQGMAAPFPAGQAPCAGPP